MDKKITTTKLWADTLSTLRMIHAFTGETMRNIMERLANDELKRVKKKGK